MKYNGINVPDTVKTDRIISAFCNPIEWGKVEEYTEIMKELMLSHSFPPIMGYPSIITKHDIGECFMNGEEITRQHIGQTVWYVTDGHHRTTAAIEANLPYLWVELDRSTITNELDLMEYDNATQFN